MDFISKRQGYVPLRLVPYIFFVAVVLSITTSNTFEEWVEMFDSPDIDAFHKTVGLTPLYRGKSLIDPKEVIVIHQAEEGVAKHVFSDPETIKNIEAGGHIYSTTKITSWVSE